MSQRHDEQSSQVPKDWIMKPHFLIDKKYLSSAGLLWKAEQKSFTLCAYACFCAHAHIWGDRSPVCSVVLFTNNQNFNFSSRTYVWSSLSQRLNFWDALTVYCVFSPLMRLSLWKKVQNDLKCIGFWDNSEELSHTVWVNTKSNYFGRFIRKVHKKKGISLLFLHCTSLFIPVPSWKQHKWYFVPSMGILAKSFVKNKTRDPHRDIFQAMLVLLCWDPARPVFRIQLSLGSPCLVLLQITPAVRANGTASNQGHSQSESEVHLLI